ncbi:MAG: hypothetical protein ACI9GZ_002234, partial [Bacteroidia bacterium]
FVEILTTINTNQLKAFLWGKDPCGMTSWWII